MRVEGEDGALQSPINISPRRQEICAAESPAKAASVVESAWPASNMETLEL